LWFVIHIVTVAGALSIVISIIAGHVGMWRVIYCHFIVIAGHVGMWRVIYCHFIVIAGHVGMWRVIYCHIIHSGTRWDCGALFIYLYIVECRIVTRGGRFVVGQFW
jgi:hypothetical protein